MKHIFIHGGPGLNSNPERHLLRLDSEHEIIFWDEPSSLRDKNYSVDKAYMNWLTSLASFIMQHSQDEDVAIIAHSFGAFAVNDILPTIQDRISRLILVAPIFNLLTLDRNILDLAIRLKARKGDIKAIKNLNELKSAINPVFDEKRFLALIAALDEDEVLPNYWHKQDVSHDYNQFFVMDEAFQIDFSSFKAVRDSIPTNVSTNKFKGEVSLCYGAFDPVARLEQDYQLLQELYPGCTIKIAQDSGHYPHVEEKSSFLEWTGINGHGFHESTDRA